MVSKSALRFLADDEKVMGILKKRVRNVYSGMKKNFSPTWARVGVARLSRVCPVADAADPVVGPGRVVALPDAGLDPAAEGIVALGDVRPVQSPQCPLTNREI